MGQNISLTKEEGEYFHKYSRNSEYLRELFSRYEGEINWDALWDAYYAYGPGEDDTDVNIAASGAGQSESDEFSNYLYSEEGDGQGRPDWNIDAGDAQLEMFKGLLPEMFAQVVEVDNLPEGNSLPVDAVFYPEVEDLQFAVPRDTKSNVFEVWIKYKLKLLNNSS